MFVCDNFLFFIFISQCTRKTHDMYTQYEKKNVKTRYDMLYKLTNMTFTMDFSYFSKSLESINFNDIPERVFLYHLASKRETQ